MGTNFVFSRVLVFFQAKSATTNNHRRELSDISYKNPLSRDWNIKLSKNFPVSRKIGLNFLIFRQTRASKASEHAYLCLI